MKNKGLLILCIILLAALVAGGYFWYQEHNANMAAKEELTVQVETLTADNEAKTAEIETLTTDNADKATQIETLTADNTAKATEIETLTADNEAKTAEIETLTTDNADKATQIETLTADNEAKATEIETLTADNEAKDTKIEALTAANEDLSDVTENVYLSTKRWLHQLNEHDFKYSLYPAEKEDDPDKVVVPMTSTSEKGVSFEYTLRTFSYPENDRLSMRVWNVIEFDPSNLASIQEVCNKLNASYLYAKFYTDESDNTVTMEYDLRMPDVPESGEIMWRMQYAVNGILNIAYDMLLPYQK